MKEKIKVIELFSGVGSQVRGIQATELWDCEVVATADIDKDAISVYASIHCNLKENLETYNRGEKFPSTEKMREELIHKNIGYDFKKKTHSVQRLKGDRLKKYWLAHKLANNLGDISKIGRLPYADLWTYSFPCTDI